MSENIPDSTNEVRAREVETDGIFLGLTTENIASHYIDLVKRAVEDWKPRDVLFAIFLDKTFGLVHHAKNVEKELEHATIHLEKLDDILQSYIPQIFQIIDKDLSVDNASLVREVRKLCKIYEKAKEKLDNLYDEVNDHILGNKGSQVDARFGQNFFRCAGMVAAVAGASTFVIIQPNTLRNNTMMCLPLVGVCFLLDSAIKEFTTTINNYKDAICHFKKARSMIHDTKINVGKFLSKLEILCCFEDKLTNEKILDVLDVLDTDLKNRTKNIIENLKRQQRRKSRQ